MPWTSPLDPFWARGKAACACLGELCLYAIEEGSNIQEKKVISILSARRGGEGNRKNSKRKYFSSREQRTTSRDKGGERKEETNEFLHNKRRGGKVKKYWERDCNGRGKISFPIFWGEGSLLSTFLRHLQRVQGDRRS